MSVNIGFKEFFETRYQANDLVVFPTGMGSELGELGGHLTPPYENKFPLWSAQALLTEQGRELVRQVHLNAVYRTGADVITTNTWMRPSAFASVSDNWRDAAYEAFGHAVRIAVAVKKEVLEQSNGERRIYVGASFGPIGDSHAYGPPLEIGDYYHGRTAQALVGAAPDDIDFLIPETACNWREAWFMTQAAAGTGKPFIVGLTPGEDGNLRDGSDLRGAVEQIARTAAHRGFTAIAINCVESTIVDKALERLQGLDIPVVVYANGLGTPRQDGGWDFDHSPAAAAQFSDNALGWARRNGITGIGGCCGTTSHSYGLHLGGAVQEERRRRVMACVAADPQSATIR